MNNLKWKRIYEDFEKEDGYRILIDRLWPRGLSKEKANIEYWAKDITPSSKIRQEFHKNEINYKVFSEKYKQELE